MTDNERKHYLARLIRHLYFVERVKQTQIAKLTGIRQGNISRVISGELWKRAETYYEAR